MTWTLKNDEIHILYFKIFSKIHNILFEILTYILSYVIPKIFIRKYILRLNFNTVMLRFFEQKTDNCTLKINKNSIFCDKMTFWIVLEINYNDY